MKKSSRNNFQIQNTLSFPFFKTENIRRTSVETEIFRLEKNVLYSGHVSVT